MVVVGGDVGASKATGVCLHSHEVTKRWISQDIVTEGEEEGASHERL